jgi:DNA-binding protein HU-beta
MLLNAYDFSNASTGFMRSGFAWLQAMIIGSSVGMLVSIILARIFLVAMQRAETLESAEDLRRKKQRRKQAEAKLNIKEEKPSSVAFSQTETYKQIKKEEATEVEDVSISIIDEVLAKVEETEEVVEETPVAEAPKPIVQKEEKETYTRVTKGDLITIIAKNSDLSEYKAKKFMNALLDEIKDQMAAKSEVKLDDFGRFYTKEHKSREAINPQTFEPITIEAYTAVKFSAYKPFKDMITMDVKETSNKAFVKQEDTPEPVVEEPVVEEPVVDPKPAVEEIKQEPKVIKEEKKEPILVTKPAPKKKKVIEKRTKIDIINLIDETTDLSKNKANKFLKYFAQVIKETLAAKDSVKIDDFGTFTTIVIPEKEGVNPITSEKIIVEAHTQVRLRFDKKFKEKIK